MGSLIPRPHVLKSTLEGNRLVLKSAPMYVYPCPQECGHKVKLLVQHALIILQDTNHVFFYQGVLFRPGQIS